MAAVKAKATKVLLSERAVFARVDRALAKDGEMIRRCREGSRGFQELGRYYTINAKISGVIEKHVDLESFARERKVLRPFEAMAK